MATGKREPFDMQGYGTTGIVMWTEGEPLPSIIRTDMGGSSFGSDD